MDPADQEGTPDHLVALVNHELRTPLTMMIGYTEMLRSGEAGDLTEDQEQMVTVVERSAARVQDLVVDLLTVADQTIGGHRCPEEVAAAVRRLAGVTGAADGDESHRRADEDLDDDERADGPRRRDQRASA